MSELRQSVTRTVYPDGTVVKHCHGMIHEPLPTTRINVWRRWLSILKAKYHWTDELKQHFYEK